MKHLRANQRFLYFIINTDFLRLLKQTTSIKEYSLQVRDDVSSHYNVHLAYTSEHNEHQRELPLVSFSQVVSLSHGNSR